MSEQERVEYGFTTYDLFSIPAYLVKKERDRVILTELEYSILSIPFEPIKNIPRSYRYSYQLERNTLYKIDYPPAAREGGAQYIYCNDNDVIYIRENLDGHVYWDGHSKDLDDYPQDLDDYSEDDVTKNTDTLEIHALPGTVVSVRPILKNPKHKRVNLQTTPLKGTRNQTANFMNYTIQKDTVYFVQTINKYATQTYYYIGTSAVTFNTARQYVLDH